LALGDERISQLRLLQGGQAEATDLAVVVDVGASETKKMTLLGLASALLRLAPGSSLDLAALNQNSDTKLTGLALAVGSVPADRLNPKSITAAQIALGAIGATELANNAVGSAALADFSVGTAELQDDAVTSQKLADGAVDADALGNQAVTYSKIQQATQGDVLLGRSESGPGTIGEIPCSSAGRDLIGAASAEEQRNLLQLGPLATAIGTWTDGSNLSGSSSGTNTGDQTITLTGAVTGSGTGLITVAIGPGQVGADQLAAGAVTTPSIADDSVVAAALADNSAAIVSTGSPIDPGDFVGQAWTDPTDGRHFTWTGSLWVQTSGITSIAVQSPDLFTASITYPDPYTASIALTPGLRANGEVWIGPATGADAPPDFRRLEGADLPAASATDRGAIRIGQGLQISESGLCTVAPATPVLRGGVTVPGPNLLVSQSGELTHAPSPLEPGAYVKVVIDDRGHVINAGPLETEDIPGIDAQKIVSGVFPAERFPPRAITRQMLANYANAYIQEADPGAQDDPPVGCLWFRESTAQLRMWNGNSWFSVGFGRLSEENLRYCGTFDAELGVITGLTVFGLAESFAIGQAVPSASDPRAGVYFVCTVEGSGVGVTPGVGYDPGDWILCNGLEGGWVRIDSALGGTGSGGAQYLNDLINVSAAAPSIGDLLSFTGAGLWSNVPRPALFVPITAGQSPTGSQLGTEQILVSNTTADPAIFIKRADGTVARMAGVGAIGAPVAATTSIAGLVQLATNAIALTGTATDQAVVPAALKHVLDNRATSESSTGLIQLATAGEASTGTNATKAITPATLKPLLDAKAGLDIATASTPGLSLLASQAEANTGSEPGKVITTATLHGRTATSTRTGLLAEATQAQVDAGTITASAVSPLTLTTHLNTRLGARSSYAKGVILAGANTSSLGVLAVGSNGQILEADTGSTLGVRWVNKPGGVTSVSGVSPISVANGTTTPAISVAAASTTQVGVVQLSAATNSTSTSLAATASAVKSAFDLAAAALPTSGGTLTGDLGNTATGFLRLPVGTTAQRPGSPTTGMARYNTSTGKVEFWNVSQWASLQTATAVTLWGQSFDGTNDVDGNLTNVGNITGIAGAVLTITSGNNLNLQTTGSGSVNINAGTTGSVNIYAGTDTGTRVRLRPKAASGVQVFNAADLLSINFNVENITQNRTIFFADGNTTLQAGTTCMEARRVDTGAGLSGGGNLTADRTLSITSGGVTTEMLAPPSSAEEVGTYSLLFNAGTLDWDRGSTRLGSNLRRGRVNSDNTITMTGQTPAGTWRNMSVLVPPNSAAIAVRTA